tara:strand:- start:58995 stop:59651 length:657 start_codon:yes stop_codon:yes gene_type:complete
MKSMTRIIAAATLVAGAMFSTNASAEVSYNIGYMSEYVFRGFVQKSSSASAGADYEQGGFYAGTWAADVGDGLEIDGYFGYGIETESGFTASLGFTGYYYTGDQFDDTYEEINLNLGYGVFGLEYSFGEHDNLGGFDEDYDYLALTVALENGFYGTYGSFGDDLDGSHIAIGYGTTIADFDVGVEAIFADDDICQAANLAGTSCENEESLIFTLGKTF